MAVRLSALRACPALPSKKNPGTHFHQRLEALGKLKKKDQMA
jgi:hypothetical protein